jgi:hypothetical protein
MVPRVRVSPDKGAPHIIAVVRQPSAVTEGL